MKLIKDLIDLFRGPDLSEYPDINPRGFVTTYPGKRMTTKQKNKNFQRMFLKK